RHAIGVADNPGQLAVIVLLLAFGKGNLWIVQFIGCLFRSFAVSEPRLNDEGIAAVDRRRPGHGSIKIALDLLVQTVENRSLTDGCDAIARRRHDFGGLNRLIKRFGGSPVNILWPDVRRKLRSLANLLSEFGGNPTEIARQKARQRMALSVVEHF